MEKYGNFIEKDRGHFCPVPEKGMIERIKKGKAKGNLEMVSLGLPLCWLLG